jgi:adenylate kinase
MKLKSNKYKTILFFGPPGSGKSTQAKLLDKKKFFYISTGELLRHMRDGAEFQSGALGKKITKIMEAGGLVPDRTMIDLLFRYLSQAVSEGIFKPDKQILIFDGIPRNTTQIRMLNDHVQVIQIIDIHFSSDSILKERIRKRAVQEGRSDDKNRGIIEKRLAIYKNETAEVLKHYPKNIIYKINGDDSVKEINQQIKNILNN